MLGVGIVQQKEFIPLRIRERIMKKLAKHITPAPAVVFLHVPPIFLSFYSPSYLLLKYSPIVAVNLLVRSPCPICIFETRHLSDLAGALQSPGQTTHPLRIYISKHVTRSEEMCYKSTNTVRGRV